MTRLRDDAVPTQAATLLRTWTRAHRRVGKIVTPRSARRTSAVSLREIIEAYLDQMYPGWRRRAA
jgi:predicted DNA-binding protein